MNLVALIFVLAVFGTNSAIKCGFSPSNLTKFDYVPEWHRLVGGKETIPNAWPWMAELIYLQKHHCGGVLITDEYLLTAAHCFARSRLPDKYRILVGGHRLYSGTMHQIKEIHFHPLYHRVRPSAYDVALIRIWPKVDNSTNAAPICLPKAMAPVHRMCVVTGWGRLGENGQRSEALREIHIPIVSSAVCNDLWHYRGRLHLGSMMCAGYSDGSVDSCQGDSGGPLACRNDILGVWEVQGLVSWGIGCAKVGFPGVYTKIFSLVPWITSTMNLSKLRSP